MKPATLTRMRRLGLAILIGLLVGGAVAGCAMTPEEREATTRAWAERDQERARECATRGGRWVSGACLFGAGG
jgi:hypothetical protein